MIWLISCLAIYFVSLWAAVQFCKQSNNEVKRDDIPLILVPGFNTFVVIVLCCVSIKESQSINNMFKCMGDFVAKVLNKL